MNAYLKEEKQMKKQDKQKGITLIALVVTIIILLILASITINALTENGLFGKVKEAKEKSEKAQIKEEIEMAIMDIILEETEKESDITLEVVENKIINKLKDIDAELNGTNIEGEYTGYYYTIDDKFNVTIGEKSSGISIGYTLSTTDFTNDDIILTINASSVNGEVTIEEIEGLTSNTDGTYTITQNGKYKITVVDSFENKRTKTIYIYNIDKLEPEIYLTEIEGIKEDGFRVNVKARDQEANETNSKSGILNYEYFLNSEVQNTSGETLELNSLNCLNDYTITIRAYDAAGNYAEVKKKPDYVEGEAIKYGRYSLVNSRHGRDEWFFSER